MTLSSQTCSVDVCERSALAVCDCHHESFCNDHFVEHTIQSTLVVNETTSVTNKSKAVSLQNQSCFLAVNRWCKDIYHRVRCSYTEKNQHSEETTPQKDIELDSAGVSNDQSRKENEVVNDHQIETMRQNLFPLQRPHRTIQVVNKNSVSTACSDKHLLIEQKPNLCLLDRTLTIVKQIPWSYNHVDICWLSAMGQFILVTKQTIFTLDETTMELQECCIPQHNTKNWSCAACSNTTLYLSTMDMSASVYEYTLRPSIEFVKEWQLSVMCPLYESVLTFSYGNERLAFVVCNAHTFQNRLDLHSIATFEILWSIPLSILARCLSINNDQWIVVNCLESQLLHISSDGLILQDYKDISSSTNPIINAVQWDNETIVTATLKSLSLHRLS